MKTTEITNSRYYTELMHFPIVVYRGLITSELNPQRRSPMGSVTGHSSPRNPQMELYESLNTQKPRDVLWSERMFAIADSERHHYFNSRR